MDITDLRLVFQARDHHPHGIYSGTTMTYKLQYRVGSDSKWRTAPSIRFEDLPEDEQHDLTA